jgi:hypothetical protein
MSIPVTLDSYLALVTSEHNQRPKYMATLSLYLQPMVDLQNLLNSFAGLFDIDFAVGQQLDFIGQWVGASRQLKQTINGISVLDDNTYRILLKAVIALNHWDGTVPGAYAIWAIVFATEGYDILIQDNQDMSMFFVFVTATLSTIVLALIINGYFDLRPAGVLMRGYFMPSVPGTPVFGFGIENDTVAGWGHGAWIAPLDT